MISAEEKVKLANRLKRISGQVSAIKRMIDGDAYCIDVLTQVAAASGALGKVGQIMLERHIQTCVIEAMQTGAKKQRQEKLNELISVFRKFSRVSD